MVNVIHKELTAEEAADYKVAFDLFDLNHDGSISTGELSLALKSLGQNPSEAELQQIIIDLDQDGNGSIEFQELMALITHNPDKVDLQQDAKDIFALFDRDNTGYITLDDLKRVIQNSGLQITETEMTKMIEEADTTGDGKLVFNDFYSIVVYLLYLLLQNRTINKDTRTPTLPELPTKTEP